MSPWRLGYAYVHTFQNPIAAWMGRFIPWPHTPQKPVPTKLNLFICPRISMEG